MLRMLKSLQPALFLLLYLILQKLRLGAGGCGGFFRKGCGANLAGNGPHQGAQKSRIKRHGRGRRERFETGAVERGIGWPSAKGCLQAPQLGRLRPERLSVDTVLRVQVGRRQSDHQANSSFQVQRRRFRVSSPR